jgi:hypothetical protein
MVKILYFAVFLIILHNATNEPSECRILQKIFQDHNVVFANLFKDETVDGLAARIMYFLNDKKKRSGLIFQGIASQPVQRLDLKKRPVKYFFEDFTGHPSWVPMAENEVFSEEWANMPDPLSTS